MSDNEGSRIDTSCGTCIFATYDEQQTQNGCVANVLSRIKKTTELTEGKDKRFLRIINFACPFWRPQGWLERFRTEDETSPPDDATLVAAARKEVTLAADIVVYCDYNTTFDSLAKTITSIESMQLGPRRLYVANNGMVKPTEMFKWAVDNINMPWRVENVFTEETDKIRATDTVSDKCPNIFISLFKAGFEVPTDFLACIDKALYDNLDRFVYLSPIDDINGLTVMRQLYNTLRGSKYGPIQEQVEELCQQQQCPLMMRPVTTIVPSMLALS